MQTWMKRAPVYAGLTFSLTLGLVACGGNRAPTPITSAVTSVTVTPATASLTVGGATATFTATVAGNGNGTVDQGVTWMSSDDTVATVDPNGVVTPVGPGTATITATSTLDTTQYGQATVTVMAAGTPPTVNANFSFRPANATTPLPSGYIAETGQPYTEARGYGWVTEASANTAAPIELDMHLNARDRKGVTGVPGTLQPAQYTFIDMQCPAAGTPGACNPPAQTAPGAFVYKVPVGKYNVTVSVGDADARTVASAPNTTYVINVEGTPVIAAFKPTMANLFATGSATVNVADGLLTVDAIGGNNTKINYVLVQTAP